MMIMNFTMGMKYIKNTVMKIVVWYGIVDLIQTLTLRKVTPKTQVLSVS